MGKEDLRLLLRTTARRFVFLLLRVQAQPRGLDRQHDPRSRPTVQSRSVPPYDAGATGTEIGMLIGLRQSALVP